jgi:superfamily II DNA or RNA helicase
LELRPYQQDCLDIMNNTNSGSHILKLSTGLGKTVIFSQYCKNKDGRHLVVVNREELVYQSAEKLGDNVGIEKANLHSNGEKIVVASIQTLHKRLQDYSHDDFYSITYDECQFCASASYRKVFDYFKPQVIWGFSATPSRHGELSKK